MVEIPASISRNDRDDWVEDFLGKFIKAFEDKNLNDPLGKTLDYDFGVFEYS